MKHSQHFLIVGFCDAAEKMRGDGAVTHFADEHRYGADHIPSQDELRKYAEQLGYYPTGKRGVVLGKCEPVYLVRGKGNDYQRCPDCFKQSSAQGAMA